MVWWQKFCLIGQIDSSVAEYRNIQNKQKDQIYKHMFTM
jgi:hypothetical protein